MKKNLLSVLFCLLLSFSVVAAQALEFDLYPLSRSDLEQLNSDANKALKQYHTSLSGSEQNSVLNPVKKLVEEYVKSYGMTNPSWPWFDYAYSRQWELLCVDTRVDVKDADKKTQSFRVHGEVHPIGNTLEVVYLKVGEMEIINRKEELPDPLWNPIKTHFINERTGIDLTILDKDELDSIFLEVKNALSQYHTVTSKGERATSGLVEAFVNDYFAQRGYTVSWPWFDYAYTCDWGCYTEKTEITCRNNENKKSTYKVYAEAYERNGAFDIIYLEIGEDIAVDKRSQIQDESYAVYQNSQIYSSALSLWKNGKYAEAKDLFLSLGSFSNSRTMAFSCIEQITGPEYAHASMLFEEGKYVEAKQAFLSLGDHEDSSQQAQKCQDKINELQYSEALALMNDGQYATAMPLFVELGNYSDSIEMAELCFAAIQEEKYQQACGLRDQQLYEQAITIFSELGEFKDSADQIVVCSEAFDQLQYDTALSAMGAGDYTNALAILTSLGAYKDAEIHATTCQEKLHEEAYTHAVELMSGGHYDEAYTHFTSLKGYSDSADMAQKCLSSKANIDRKISFTETELYIYLNKSTQLKPAIEPLTDTAPSTSKVIYRSSDASIVRVQKNGTISAAKEGTTRIICSTEDNPDNVTEVIVHVVLPVNRVTLDQSELKIQMVESDPAASAVTLQTTVAPATAYDQTLAWTTSNEKVAKVDANGTVTPVGVGSATITATANDKTNGIRKATCTVRVTLAVTSISLDKQEGTVFIGKSEKLTATVMPEKAADKKVLWSSSDTTVATVNSSGMVKGVAAGSAIITAKTSNGIEASYSVTVKQGPATFSLSISATLVASNHVGSKWGKAFYVDEKQFSGSTTFTAELGQTVSISGEITENDSNPDYGFFSVNLTMTEDVFMSGYSETKEVYVRENGGRYSGNRAEWKVVIKVKKR